MKRTLAVLIATCAGGCAATRQPPASTLMPPPQYVEASASALAFDPPMDEGAAHPEFARAPRQASAFMGFEEENSEFHLRATNDLQTNTLGDFYTQQSFSVKSSARYR